MAASNSEEQSPERPRTFGQKARRAGLFILFGTILVIPRIRRLRRRVWAWTCVRLIMAACGGWLVWHSVHARAGAAALAMGLLLLTCSLLFRSKPVVKSVDAITHELSALIALNGGTFRQSPDSHPIHPAQIFVHPEKIIVLGPREHRLLEIPLAKVRSLEAYPVPNGTGDAAPPWEVKIGWVADAPCTTTFHYDGIFAEHLARVTESTLRSQWIKDLPVIRQ